MADLKNALPKTWSSPTMSPHCADETKYGVVDAVVKHFEALQKKGDKVAGQKIRDLVTVNGVRVTVEDGSWGLVRASSNKPELVVVVESPVSRSSGCTTCSRRWIRCCARIRKSARTIRRFDLPGREQRVAGEAFSRQPAKADTQYAAAPRSNRTSLETGSSAFAGDQRTLGRPTPPPAPAGP